LRSYLWRWRERCLRSFRGRHLRGALVLLAAIAGVGFALASDSATVEAQEYSAYDDAEKPAISLILSEGQNVEQFQEEFGLSDEEIEQVRAAVLEENEALATAYAESEQIAEANAGLSEEQIAEKIAASDYHEKVRAAIAETKSSIESLLPEDRRPELRTWVDAKFTQEGQEFSEDSSTTYGTSSRKKRGVSCKVFATQYHGHTRSEVALPHRVLKDKGGYTVIIHRGNRATKARVKDVGPWNIRDNYWQSGKHRDMWDNLRRCTPEAEAAYFKNYNNGKDQFGRKVLNPAGVDLTPRVAGRLGLKKYENAWVHVRYPWVGR
jgi:hypothetical protein